MYLEAGLLSSTELSLEAPGQQCGLFQNGVVKSKDKQLRDVVMRAIDVGYRHFDTASVYETEQEIGEAVKMKIEEGVVKREDIFITTKVFDFKLKSLFFICLIIQKGKEGITKHK